MADVIFTVVTGDKAIHDIFLGPNNLFKKAKGKLFINCATISSVFMSKLEKLGTELGAEGLEAPMASSMTRAREGKLYMMLSGDEAAFQKAQLQFRYRQNNTYGGTS